MVYSGQELMLAVVGAALMFGTLGFVIGRSGLIEKCFWSKCVFIGTPPEPYENWWHFCLSPVKADVTIRASKVGDWVEAKKFSNVVIQGPPAGGPAGMES